MCGVFVKDKLCSGFFAQVAEWLKAADCKSAALKSYGGSNPPLCTIVEVCVYEEQAGVSRFLLAMLLFVGLAVAAWRTLSDGTTRAVTLAVIASFAVRTYLQYRGSGGK